MISIPSDLRKNKDTIIGNMDLRECICLFLGLLLALGILYYIRVVLGYKRIVIAAFIAGLFIIPFLFIGFKRINGMKIDDYFKVFINNKIIANSNRVNICPYVEAQVRNSKYELIRYYKLKLRKEALMLRETLKEKNNLILTEYIDYNDSRYAIFRLDGKELILNQIKRNKELIEDKKKEIRDFIKNVVKRIKKEKIKLTKKNRAARKRQYKQIDKLRKERLKSLYRKVDKLKVELKTLKSKTFEILKDEVDIFESLSNVKAERILVKESNKKQKEVDIDNLITSLRNNLNEDERQLCQIHLFNKASFRDFIESLDNKIVFINANNEVDVYFYDAGARIARPYDVARIARPYDGDYIARPYDEAHTNRNVGASSTSPLVDIIKLDKQQGLYRSSILSLEARNFYNHYRSINNLEEIL